MAACLMSALSMMAHGANGPACTLIPPTTPAPVVINWHGCNNHYPILDYHIEISKTMGAAMDQTSRLAPWLVGQQATAVAVINIAPFHTTNRYAIFPLGTKSNLPNGAWGWNTPDDAILCGRVAGKYANDTAFALEILDWIDQNICADTTRIYTTGFSTGAFLSNNLGCLFGHRFAGIATDAGLVAKDTLRTCTAPGLPPVPAITFHSSADPTVPIAGNLLWASQDEVDDMWRTRNGCTAGVHVPAEVTINTSTTVCTRWRCPGAAVESCRVSGLDHCWIGGRSGGFPTCVPRPGDVDATEHSMQFWADAVKG